MLREDLDQHIGLHHALGFKFRSQALLLRNFVAYAEARGDQIVSADRALAWAVQAPSPEQRRNRLLEARRFAIAMHAQDSRHEIPAADALGRGLSTRRIPYIYSEDDIHRLMAAAASLAPAGTIRPVTFATLFGLLAATGMRISEALALRLSDITDDWPGHREDLVQEEPAAPAPPFNQARTGQLSGGPTTHRHRERRLADRQLRQGGGLSHGHRGLPAIDPFHRASRIVGTRRTQDSRPAPYLRRALP